MTRLRNYFLTGFIVTAPLAITAYLAWSFIGWVDSWVKPYIPARYSPDTYLPFAVPGFGLIEYPRRGAWAIVFISSERQSEVNSRIGEHIEDSIAVFLPSTPNPTTGFLMYVPRAELIELSMTVEEAAKLVISAGLVAPERLPVKKNGKKVAELVEPPREEGGRAAS